MATNWGGAIDIFNIFAYGDHVSGCLLIFCFQIYHLWVKASNPFKHHCHSLKTSWLLQINKTRLGFSVASIWESEWISMGLSYIIAGWVSYMWARQRTQPPNKVKFNIHLRTSVLTFPGEQEHITPFPFNRVLSVGDWGKLTSQNCRTYITLGCEAEHEHRIPGRMGWCRFWVFLKSWKFLQQLSGGSEEMFR